MLQKSMARITNLVLGKEVVAHFRVDGGIGEKSHLKLMKDIEKALKSKKRIKAVAFSINSPGGSPVYSDLMASKILDYAARKNVPLYTFAEHVAASGGYYLLCIGAPGKVYSAPDSVVGSIGVISA